MKKTRIIVSVGSGGVGKTSLSAGLGLMFAEQGNKVLLVTVDPSRRLASLLNIKNFDSEIVQTNWDKYKLDSLWLNPEIEFDRFVKKSVSSNEDYEKLEKNILYKQLKTTMSGSQEFTSHLRLLEEARSGKYDVVILDTPPVQNTKDFLDSPKNLHKLFTHKAMSFFNEDKSSWFKRNVLKTGQKAIGIIEKFTGGEFVRSLKDFFSLIEVIASDVARVSDQASKLMKSGETEFVLVTDPLRSQLCLETYNLFSEEGFRMSNIIINRVFPQWPDVELDQGQISDLYQVFVKLSAFQQEGIEQLEKALDKSCSIVKIPEYSKDLKEITDLRFLANRLGDISNES